MTDKSVMLAALDSIYEARVSGDKATLDAHWAEDGRYRMACDPALVPVFPSEFTSGPEAVSSLVEMFRFHQIERLDTVVDGTTAVTTLRAKLNYGAQPPVATEICDIWKFDEAGKVASLVQFGDTALIRQLMSAGAG